MRDTVEQLNPRQILSELFPKEQSLNFSPVTARGVANTKFYCRLADGREYLVRVNEKGIAETVSERFRKAKCCADLCLAESLPAPTVVRVGMLQSGRPYSVETWVSGARIADELRDPAERRDVWFNLGRLSRQVHEVKLEGLHQQYRFGYDGESCSEEWVQRREYLARLIAANQSFGFTVIEKERLCAMVQAVDVRRYPEALSHGDLKLDSVLIRLDSQEIVSLLDWELARYVPSPLGEMSTSFEPAINDNKRFAVARSREEREAFVSGYGLNWDEVCPDFLVFYLGDVLTNVAWYQEAIVDPLRKNREELKARFSLYHDGVRGDVEELRAYVSNL